MGKDYFLFVYDYQWEEDKLDNVIVSIIRETYINGMFIESDVFDIPLNFDYMGISDMEVEFDKELWRDIVHVHSDILAQQETLPTAMQMKPLIENNYYGI